MIFAGYKGLRGDRAAQCEAGNIHTQGPGSRAVLGDGFYITDNLEMLVILSCVHISPTSFSAREYADKAETSSSKARVCKVYVPRGYWNSLRKVRLPCWSGIVLRASDFAVLCSLLQKLNWYKNQRWTRATLCQQSECFGGKTRRGCTICFVCFDTEKQNPWEPGTPSAHNNRNHS